MKRKIVIFIVTMGLLTGCSAFRSPKERLTIMTNQSDASVFVNGNRVGKGMVQTKVKRNKNVQVMATKPGYQTAYYNIDSNLNTTGILDIVGILFFIFPVIGLFCPGSKSLDETNIALNLDPIVSPTSNQ